MPQIKEKLKAVVVERDSTITEKNSAKESHAINLLVRLLDKAEIFQYEERVRIIAIIETLLDKSPNKPSKWK